MEYMLKSETQIIADTYPAMVGSDAEAKLHYLLNALESMDKRTASELERVNVSGTDEDLKEFVRQDILVHHEALRLPLVEAVEDLRTQYRATVTADND
jgi:hypothetical protein